MWTTRTEALSVVLIIENHTGDLDLEGLARAKSSHFNMAVCTDTDKRIKFTV